MRFYLESKTNITAVVFLRIPEKNAVITSNIGLNFEEKTLYLFYVSADFILILRMMISHFK